MKSKGYQKFSTRLVYFRYDMEMADILFLNRERLGEERKIFMRVSPERHPMLAGRESSNESRKLVMTHLRKSIFVAFIKEMYEEVTEYIQYILYQGSRSGVDAKRIVGEHHFSMAANEILALAHSGEIEQAVIKKLFNELESERSTIALLKKVKNKLGLNIDQKLIDMAVPFLTCRHILVHADGKPDDEFQHCNPEIKIDAKGRIVLNMEFLNKAYDAVNNLLLKYDGEMIKKKYISGSELVP